MRRNVSTLALVISTALLLSAPAAYADLEITGIISTGGHQVWIENAQFIGDSMYVFDTPNWGGDTMTTDSFSFPRMYGPPQMVLLVGTLDGAATTIPLADPQSDTWYVIPSSPPEAQVKLVYKTGGVNEQGQLRPGQAVLTVTPSIVGAGATVRAERVAGASCVFELYDAVGNRVRTFRTQPSASGVAAVDWSGEDDHGQRLPDGIYYCCLDDAAGPVVRRLILVR